MRLQARRARRRKLAEQTSARERAELSLSRAQSGSELKEEKAAARHVKHL